MTKKHSTTSRLHQPIPRAVAETVLFDTPTFVVLLAALTATFLVGIRFYVETMPSISTFLWPLYADSPTAIAFAVMSVMTVAPFAYNTIDEVQNTHVTAYVHTFAFAWLVKYGVWVAIALNIKPGLYIANGGGWFSYPMIIFSHSLFVLFAFVIVEYGTTTKDALTSVFVLLLVNDVYDYWFGFHPPLRYDPGIMLPIVTVGLSVAVVTVAWWQFDKLSVDAN